MDGAAEIFDVRLDGSGRTQITVQRNEGEKGKAGMATEGTGANAARDLGLARTGCPKAAPSCFGLSRLEPRFSRLTD